MTATAEWGRRLYRTPYLVLPRLAIEAMPKEWQDRLEQLLVEGEEAGLETPSYYVFRDVNVTPEPFEHTLFGVKNVGDFEHPFYVFAGMASHEDPWANYRHGNIADVCPTFKRGGDDASDR